jgi:hypothetical protein
MYPMGLCVHEIRPNFWIRPKSSWILNKFIRTRTKEYLKLEKPWAQTLLSPPPPNPENLQLNFTKTGGYLQKEKLHNINKHLPKHEYT